MATAHLLSVSEFSQLFGTCIKLHVVHIRKHNPTVVTYLQDDITFPVYTCSSSNTAINICIDILYIYLSYCGRCDMAHPCCLYILSWGSLPSSADMASVSVMQIIRISPL